MSPLTSALVRLEDTGPGMPVGGKAAALAELVRAGIRIPESYCIPASCENDDLREELSAALSELEDPVAVRSSATCEDGHAASFAGQFKSFLNLHTVDEVEAAVRKCRVSHRERSVLEYCTRQGIDPETIRMGVIVQRMIEPDRAGVCFTVNPLTGSEEEIVIEWCEGLADELLTGKRSGHREVVRGTAAPEWRELVETARRIERHFGAPQDIEWAIGKGILYILQARPITRVGFAPEIGEWTNADFRDGGVASGVVTPLMWSLYEFIWERSLKPYLRELRLLDRDEDFEAGRLFFQRPYWNLGAVKRCLEKLPGFIERGFDSDLNVRITYEGDGVRTPLSLRTLWSALRVGRALNAVYRRQADFDHEFLNGGFEALIRRYEIDPSTLSDEDLYDQFSRLIEQGYAATEINYFRTIFVTSFAKLEFMADFEKVARRSSGVSYTRLMGGLDEMRHLAPTRVLWTLARTVHLGAPPAEVQKRFKELVYRFRHHSRRELDLSVPRWDEDAGFVRELLEHYVRFFDGGQDPEATARRQREAYLREREKALKALPLWSRKSFAQKLERLRHYLWLREEMRDCSSRMYYQIRRWVLEMGRRAVQARRLDSVDDIFSLRWQETPDLPKKVFRPVVAERRQRSESYRAFKAPNEIGSRWTLDSSPAPRGKNLKGIGASQGKARGRARVIRCLEEAGRVQSGDILICPFTDPGWTPVLNHVRGVVTETGGMLSHAAVICREYGIPAVLGVAGATDVIRDGQVIAVDGGKGLVEIGP